MKSTVEIYAITWKLLGYALISFVFAAAGVWIQFGQTDFLMQLIGVALLLGGASVGAQLLVRFWRERQHPGPRVVLTPEALRLQSWDDEYIVIPWADIKRWRQWGEGGDRLILIDVKPGFKANGEQPPIPEPEAAKTFQGQGFYIVPTRLDISRLRLESLLDQYMKG